MNLFPEAGEQVQLEDLVQRYVLRKIVYVNSARHGYSEIAIDRHMALFGDNNEGKTASLAGLKLALFPDDSFTHCERKFRFSGKDGSYSKEDSYRFYFPSPRSYIIAEAENPDGVFCMVLYRAQAEWAYGRFLVPAPYGALRPLFWDETALDGEGDFAPLLDLPALQRALKPLGAVQVSDARQIAEYLYDGYRGDPSRSRFCLFPLNDGASREAIEAFRNLYQIAFDVGQTDRRTLPRAIATIIEMQRGRREERLSADLDALQSEYRRLADERAQLDRVENQLPVWTRLAGHHEEYHRRRGGLVSAGAALNGRLVREHEEAGRRQLDIQREVALATRGFEAASERHDERYRRYQQAEGELRGLQRRLEAAETDYRRALAVREAHPGLDPLEIAEALDERTADLARRLEALQSEAELQARTRSCIARKKDLGERRRKLEERLERSEPGLLEQLSPAAADALHALCPDLARVPRDLPEAVRDEAERFAAHLTPGEGCYAFAGTPLPAVGARPFDLAALRAGWQADIDGWTRQIAGLEREITENTRGLASGDRKEVLVQAVAAELEQLRGDRVLIVAIERLEADYQQSLAALEEAAGERETLQRDHVLAREALEQAQAERAAVEERRRALAPLIDRLQAWRARVARLGLADSDPEGELAEVVAEPVAEDEILRLEGEAKDIAALRGRLIDLLHRLLAEGLLAGVDPFEALDEDARLDQRVSRLAVLFAELAHKRDLHGKAVAHHNTHVDNQLQELREARGTLERFVRSLNDELNRHRVSNLAAIRLRLDLNAQFSQLLAEMDRYDLQRDELIAPEFYQRLASFCADFFDSRRHRLKLEMIIAGIRYEYQREGSERFDTKGQSGGTTSTTTALILSILLNRISPRSASVGVPIIVDEIGTLDSRNTRTAIRTVAEHGFAVFCATPKPESTVMEGIGRWLAIDRFRVARPRVADCHTCILPSMIESFGECEADQASGAP